MARQKTGFSYYQVDTDRYQDRRVRKLLRRFRGGVGIAVYDCILCEVFRDRGHSLIWDEDTIFDISEILGVTEKTIEDVVKFCGQVGLFDDTLLEKGIITSRSIQERYKDMSERTKRKTTIPKEVLVIPDYSEECGENSEEYAKNSEECGENSEEYPKNSEFSQRNKRKENKIKENKNTQSVCENAHPPTHSPTREEKLFEEFTFWCEQNARLSLAFIEPLRLDHFVWLLKTYGIVKMRYCASDLHNKEAYKSNRNAMNVWKKWIEKVQLPSTEVAKVYRRP